MPNRRSARIRLVVVGIAVALIVVLGVVVVSPSLREKIGIPWFEQRATAAETRDKGESATLIWGANARPGLKLTKEAMDGLQVTVEPVKRARQERALPAQTGTINFDIDRLFSVPARFTGEIAEIAQVNDEERVLSGEQRQRPLRYGDRVKQGDLLAVVYSQPIGAAKAALVDAMCSLKLSQAKEKRYKDLYDNSLYSYAQYEASLRQVEADTNALLLAERSLYAWKLTKDEVVAVKKEAESLLDKSIVRDAELEAKKWARVEVRVPVFDPTDLKKELVIVEKNTNLGAMVDPINTTTPLFRLSDMTRMQIWAHPPAEYLPHLSKMLENGPGNWDIRFPADPDKEPLKLGFFQIAPSLEPFEKTPMVIGYLKNPDMNGVKHKFGEFVTVTLYVPPPEAGAVEIPTDALNEINGESFVLVQPDLAKNEYLLRRVVVLMRFKDFCFVRGNLKKEDEEQSQREVKKGRRPLETLQENDRVVTRGILELTACLETLLTKKTEKP